MTKSKSKKRISRNAHRRISLDDVCSLHVKPVPGGPAIGRGYVTSTSVADTFAGLSVNTGFIAFE